jgi:hypothetical protein
MTRYFQVIHNDSGEPVPVNGEPTLTLAEAQGVIERRAREFDPANSPEPYAPWGLSVIEADYDDVDQVVHWRRIDWREVRRIHLG